MSGPFVKPWNRIYNSSQIIRERVCVVSEIMVDIDLLFGTESEGGTDNTISANSSRYENVVIENSKLYSLVPALS